MPSARLRDELERTRTALEERKVIDRAKGILMKAQNLTEEAAYALLRKTAMNENKKIAEVAQSVVTAAELLQMSASDSAIADRVHSALPMRPR